MNDLIFAVPEFREGLNLTVRRGDKWSKENGNLVNLVDLDGNNYGTTPILAEKTIFDQLEYRPDELQLEHEASCRNYDGLRESMGDVYEGFTSDEEVTLVWFIYHKPD